VNLILDLAGYSPSSQRLAATRLLEPSCGDGAFLTSVISRLLESERLQVGSIDWSDKLLNEALRAADISAASILTARALVIRQLVAAGCPSRRASALADRWIVHTDFLLGSWPVGFDFVIGNPPYVRIEGVPRAVLARYRELYETTTDRADLYVAFIEKGLQLLAPTGALAFICANRFTKNKYGATLRRLIASRYHVRFYLNLEHTQPFLSNVSAYPAIFVVDRARSQRTLAATLTDISAPVLSKVRSETLGNRSRRTLVSSFATWYPDGAPWISTHRDDHSILTRFERELPALEHFDAGEYYPHHNVYWITSDSWPLLALKALLRSALVSKQVASYSVQMRGGSVRYQAQTLRRIRIPRLDSLGDTQLAALEQVATSDDQEGIDAVVEAAFGVTLKPARQ
jgi:adenine-specific DNA-methyltransferase